MFGLRKNVATPSLRSDASLLDVRTQQALARAERSTKSVEREIARANAKLLATSMKADRIAANVPL